MCRQRMLTRQLLCMRSYLWLCTTSAQTVCLCKHFIFCFILHNMHSCLFWWTQKLPDTGFRMFPINTNHLMFTLFYSSSSDNVSYILIADFCVLHQLTPTLHQSQPSGSGVQWPATLPLWLLCCFWTPQELPLPERWQASILADWNFNNYPFCGITTTYFNVLDLFMVIIQSSA